MVSVPISLIRKCWDCGRDVKHKSRETYLYALRNKWKCAKCCQQKYDGPFIRDCPICHRKMIYKYKSHRDCALRENKKCHWCGNNHSTDNEYKRKQRIARINYLNKTYSYQVKPVFNINACQYFDILNKQNTWNLQHAMNGGEFYLKELGYWLDAYDEKKNVIVEYDESKHYDRRGNLKKKDVDRMNEICHHLHCEFYRYNEPKKELKKYEYTS